MSHYSLESALRFRIRRANRSPLPLFAPAVRYLMDFINNEKILSSIVEEVRKPVWGFEDELERLRVSALAVPDWLEVKRYHTNSFDEHIALSFACLEAIATAKDCSLEAVVFLVRTIEEFLTGIESDNWNANLDNVRYIILDDVEDWFEERIEDETGLMRLLDSYASRVRHTRRSRTRAIATEGLEGRIGAAALALDLEDWTYTCQDSYSVKALDDVKESKFKRVTTVLVPEDADEAGVKRILGDAFAKIASFCVHNDETAAILVAFMNCKMDVTVDLPYRSGSDVLELQGRNIFYLQVDLVGLGEQTEPRLKLTAKDLV